MKIKTCLRSSMLIALIAAIIFPMNIIAPAMYVSAVSNSQNYYAFLFYSSDDDLGGSTRRDAEAMQAALLNIRTASGDPIPAENITVVDDSVCTTDSIAGLMNERFSKMGEDDLGIFFYSGHGDVPSSGFVDSNLLFPDSNGSMTTYSPYELSAELQKYNGKFLVNIFACNSGGFIAKSKDEQEDGASSKQAISNPFHDRSKFYVMASCSVYELDYCEDRGNNTLDFAMRTYAGALGIAAQTWLDPQPWLGKNQPLGAFASDTNKDGKLTFSELTSWTSNNTAIISVQHYPQRSDDVLFTYASSDTRRTSVISNVSVSSPIVESGKTIELRYSCYDSQLPTVEMTVFSTLGITYEILPSTPLGSNQYRVTIPAKDNMIGALVSYTIIHPRQGAVSGRLFVEDVIRPPTVTVPEDTSGSQPSPLIPLQGSEYRVTVQYTAPCLIDLVIRNPAGKAIRTLALGDLSRPRKGVQVTPFNANSYYWDGTNDAGRPVAAGIYSYSITVRNSAGSASVSGGGIVVGGDYEDSDQDDPGFTITTQINNTHTLVNGQPVRMNNSVGNPIAPKQLGGKVFIPLRFISEQMGAKVSWDDSIKTAFLSYGNCSVSIKLGEKFLVKTVEGYTESIEIEQPAHTISGSTYLPLRVVGESLGCYVGYTSNETGSFAYVSTDELTDTRRKVLFDEGLLSLNPLLPEVNPTEIVLKAELNHAVNKGRIEQISSPIRIVEEKTLVPLSYVAAALGATSAWDSTTNTATFKRVTTLGTDVVSVTAGKPWIIKNTVQLDAGGETRMLSGTPYVPIRGIAEAYNLQVYYEDGTIIISENILTGRQIKAIIKEAEKFF